MPNHVATAVQLIHRQIDNENNRKIMPKCIYLRNGKESKSRQCGPREGRRWAAKVAPMLQFGRLDHRRRDDSVQCCKSQVHLLKFGNVKGELMATQNIVFPVGSESVKRTFKCGLPVPELSHAMQSWIGVNLDIQEHKLAEFYLA